MPESSQDLWVQERPRKRTPPTRTVRQKTANESSPLQSGPHAFPDASHRTSLFDDRSTGANRLSLQWQLKERKNGTVVTSHHRSANCPREPFGADWFSTS